MALKSRLGHKVRRLRRQRGLTQIQMAEELGISASYLNLIEHDRRPVTVPLLLKLAHQYDVDVAALAEDDTSRLLGDLTEVFGDVLFEGHDLRASDVESLLDASPELGRAVVSLYRAYRESLEDTSALAERLSEGGGATGLEPARLPSEEVSDFLQEHTNHFPEVEAAAEALRLRLDRDARGLDGAMGEHLAAEHGVTVDVRPSDEIGDVMRRLDAESRRLLLSEALPPRARLFQLAHQIALLELPEVMERAMGGGTLSTPDSRALGRVALANYFAGAVLMPYEPFLAAARSLRYDIERLGHRFRTSFEQVCHRLTTLHRPGDTGVPFHMVRVDIAGNVSKRFSASGIRFARFSGACPRWNVHAAFLQPGFIRTQVSRMPDGTTFFCMARTVRREGGGFHSAQSRLAIGLGCALEHARELVYADGVDLDNLEAAVAIGPTCRLCERLDCSQRAFPPLHERLELDENVRGLSFYVSPKNDGV